MTSPQRNLRLAHRAAPCRGPAFTSCLTPGAWLPMALLCVFAVLPSSCSLRSEVSPSNCAALSGTCVCVTEEIAQCVDTNAPDLNFLRGLRNRSRFSEIIVYHNSIPTLRNSTFHSLQLTSLRNVILAYNGIVTVEPKAFTGLRKLKKLVLARNNIQFLHPTTFQNATKLSLVDLSDNQISDLGAVRNAPNLEDCRLANNSVNRLPARSFCHGQISRLKTIVLAKNEIHSVDSRALQGLNNLETLNMSENKITNLHTSTLNYTPNLRELDLRKNRISSINFVCGATSLKYVFLSNNRITKVANESFVCRHQSSLIHIDLSENRISEIDSAAFQGLHNVWDVILSRNNISHIHPTTFINATNMRLLDLSYNRLSTLHFVRDIIMLLNLDLSHNDISAIPSGTFLHQNFTQVVGNAIHNTTTIKFVLARTITSISLAHNKLTSIERSSLEGLYKLHHLDVSNNNIAYLSPTVFQGHTQLTFLNIKNNSIDNFDPLVSAVNLDTCELSMNRIPTLTIPQTETIMIRHLNITSNNVSYLPVQALANYTNLVFLNLSDNQLNTTAFIRHAPVLEYAYLMSNQLTTLPRHAFKPSENSTLKVVDLSYNSISSVHQSAFEGVTTLTNLNLAGNQISTISLSLFQHITRLKELNLNKNQISHLDFLTHLSNLKYLHMSDNRISEITNGTFSASRAIFFIDMSGNSLISVQSEVFCNLQHLSRVDLSRNSISFVSSEAFTNTTKLRNLNLSHNMLSSVGFLRDLVSLEDIDLSHNHITSIPDAIFPGTTRPRLNRLNLANNRLSIIGPSAFRSLVWLHALNLTHNSLSTLHLATFLQCSSLLQLALGANRLSRLSDIPHVPRLKHLYVFGNRLTHLANDSFQVSRLAQVVHLNLSGSGITSVESGAFAPLRVLRYLDLSRNNLSSLPETLFHANTLLSALDLSHNALLHIDGILQFSPCLEFFDASANSISTLSNETFHDQIRYIDLASNQVTNIDFEMFRHLKKLEVLDLSGNGITSTLPDNRPENLVILVDNSTCLSTKHEKRHFNLYDTSRSELHKFANLYMWMLQKNNNTT